MTQVYREHVGSALLAVQRRGSGETEHGSREMRFRRERAGRLNREVARSDAALDGRGGELVEIEGVAQHLQ